MKVKKDNKLIIFGIIVVIILAIIAFIVSKPKNKIDYDKMTDEEISVAIQEDLENKEKEELSKMGERDRMEYYVSEFVDEIENENYEEAYSMLYDDFKKNYFPTLDQFEEYAKTKFPRMFALEHTNIERNGNTYVLWVTLGDLLGSKDSAVEMNFVIQENDLNDFVMSFTVK